MKKLLSLSVLAAALVSTVAFAAPVKAALVAGNATPATPAVLLVKQDAASNVLATVAIVQTALNNSNPGIEVRKVNFVVDNNNNLNQGLVVVSRKIEANDVDALRVAVAAGTRQATGKNGANWQAVKFVASNNGPDVGTIYFIDSREGNNDVKGIAIKANNSQVTFTQVKAAEAIVSELQDSKKKASLVAAASNS